MIDRRFDIGVFLIATGDYKQFAAPLVRSLEANFLTDHNVAVLLACDEPHGVHGVDNVIPVTVDHQPWPLVTLERYRTISRYREELLEFDYVFHMDADMLVVGEAGDEILPPDPLTLVGTRHPGYPGSPMDGPFETDRASTAFVDRRKAHAYFTGAFSGGTAAAFLEMAETIAERVDRDRRAGITAIWHDESHLNRYFVDNPVHVLTPSYCFPDGWDLPFDPCILAIQKETDFGKADALPGTVDDPGADEVARLQAIQERIREASGGEEMLERLGALESRIAQRDLEPPSEAPEPTPPGPTRTLTIGMACHNDFDGVYFSVHALRLYHPEVADRVEIMVLDNAPWRPEAWDFKRFENTIQNYRYIPAGDLAGTAVRDRIFRESTSDWVMVIDSHVLLEPGSLAKLLDYIDDHPTSDDLIQGPMLGDDLVSVTTHMDPTWNDGMFGVWGCDDRGTDATAEPFTIPMHGLGLFACRREAWPGFNPRFRGFGGEEGYIHEKFKRRGDSTLCLPFLRWLHRFQRPSGPQYSVTWDDRIRNYLIGFEEVGLEPQSVIDHFAELLGDQNLAPIADRVRAEIENPFSFFDAIFCINLDTDPGRWKNMQQRFERLGIANRVERFPAVETPESHHIGCTLSHRKVIDLASRRGLANVLVFEDDAVFRSDTVTRIRQDIEDLNRVRDWKLFYLGGVPQFGPPAPVAGAAHLAHGNALTQTHAIAYNRCMFDELLRAIPDSIPEVRKWTETTRPAIDQWLAFDVTGRKYMSAPVLSVQPYDLPYLPSATVGLFS